MNITELVYRPNALTLGQLHDPLIALNPDLAKLTYKGLAIVQGMGVDLAALRVPGPEDRPCWGCGAYLDTEACKCRR
jgi:hypothetical protein